MGAGLLALCACASPETSAWNLRQVHDPDGSASYTGNLRTDLEAQVMGLGGGTSIGGQRLPSIAAVFGIEPTESEPEAIDDPYEVALESCLELASFDPEKDPEVRALQVETFGWLAGDSAFPLVRERSALELGRLGRTLGGVPPKAQVDPSEALGPDALLEQLQAVVRAAGGSGDLEEAALALESASLDRAGLRRAVRTLTILRFGGAAGERQLPAAVGFGGGTAPAQRLASLHDTLQASLVAQSLSAALDDPVGQVRAAGVEAAVVSTDNGLPGLLQGAALRGGEEVVVVRALDLLERRGIPRWDGPDAPEELETYRRSWAGLCVGLLQSAYEGPIAVAAAQALAQIAPEGPRTLRPEAWIRWFDESAPWAAAEGRAAAEGPTEAPAAESRPF